MSEKEVILRVAAFATALKEISEEFAEIVSLLTKRVEVEVEDGAEVSVTITEGD